MSSTSPSSDSPVLALDFETYYDADCSVSKMGYWAYTHHPDFQAYIVAAAGEGFSTASAPKDFPWERVHGAHVIAHNAAFDRAVFERLQEDGVIPSGIRPGSWSCTAALAAFCQCPRGLADAVSAILHRDISKATRKAAKGHADINPAMLDYAKSDAQAGYDIWRAAGHLWPEHEREVWRITDAMGRHGVCLDVPYLQHQMEKIDAAKKAAAFDIPWSAKFPPTSTTALKEHCEFQKLELPPGTDDDDPDVAAWKARNAEAISVVWVDAMQRWRRANRSRRVLEAFLSRPNAEGRMEAHLLYCGAATGRWSGGGHGLNLQNLTSGGDWDLRGCIVPAPGYRFAIIDYSQIEARVLLWAVGDMETLALVRRGISVYEAHARATMGWTGGPLKKEDPRLYRLAKARVLGLGYGCGNKKFAAVAKTMAKLDLTQEEATEAVSAYRKANPGVVRFWNDIGLAFSRRHGSHFSVRLPSGRSLWYRDVDKDTGTAEQIRGNPRAYVYGGLLVENYVQATARDIFADRLLALASAGDSFTPVLLVHDEYVIEVPEVGAEEALREAERILCTPPEWADTLPLGVEGRLAERYGK